MAYQFIQPKNYLLLGRFYTLKMMQLQSRD